MKDRLDKVLVRTGLFQTRARAGDAIARGCITINGTVVTKPGRLVDPDTEELKADDPASAYVSRAALKLKHAMEAFGLTATGCHALDIGQSTGGFTQILLEAGADRVTGIEVGHDQLASPLKNDRRIELREGVNARHLSPDDFDGPFDCIVCDVSFISLIHILPPALSLAGERAWAVFLIKPQFEVGPENIGKNGLVENQDSVNEAVGRILLLAENHPDWTAEVPVPSPLTGGDGNQEYLLVLKKENSG